MATLTTGRTGEKCLHSGIYVCDSHASSTIALSKGDTFPPCKESGKTHGTTWTLKVKA